jgi:predicted RNA-binding Zn-ribbon protein involved in translation (DUF1610 family)
MKARFYCESCGREVPANALRCPYCKKTFTSVRCPGCGFEGRAEDFSSGCPVCGHSAPAEAARPVQRGPARLPEGGGTRRGLPPVFYGAAAVVLAAGIVALLIVLFLRG